MADNRKEQERSNLHSTIWRIAKEGLNDRYINRIIKLALLAPQRQLALLEGKVSFNRALDKVILKFPTIWDKQEYCLKV